MAEEMREGFGIECNEAEVDRCKQDAQLAIARWVAEMEGQGIDGQTLIDQAKKLIAEKSR